MFFVRRLTFTFVALLIGCGIARSQTNIPPQTTAKIPAFTLYSGAPAKVVSLTNYFTDPDTTEVRLTTALGTIDFALYDKITPITVANFLNYVDTGRYEVPDSISGGTAPLVFHRSVPGFIIQSGGYVATANPSNSDAIQLTPVTTYPTIKNEPGISNVRGTVAMAKLPNAPDSATSQFFINLADNSGPPNNLDTEDGGFTVFARVVGNGMAVADAIAALPNYNFGGDFTNLPLRDYSSSDYTSAKPVTLDNVVSIPSFERVPALTFSASSDHPALAKVAVSEGNLLITPLANGTANITVTATDVDGASVSQTFTVTMIDLPPRLANISTRGLVSGTPDNPLIGGFIVGGNTTQKRVAIRAIGPSLAGAGLTNALADPTLELHDSKGKLIASNDNWQSAANAQSVIDIGLAPKNLNESVILTTLPASTAGIGYTAVVRGAGGGSGIALVEVYDLDSGPGSSVLNISTRGDVESGDSVMIGGVIVAGVSSQQVLLRAIGPSLVPLGVPNALSDPTLTLYNSNGAQIAFNDNWQTNPAAKEIEATGIPPTNPKESALLQTLAAGGYTAIVRGAGTATGTALVEAYTVQ